MGKTRQITPFFIIFAIIVAYYFFKLPTYYANVFSWNLTDSDDVGRVLQVRAWLGGQGFYDLFNHRANPPFGADMHWSRLSDIPLAATELILRPFLGVEMAEKYGVLITPIWLCLVFAFVAGMVAKRFNPSIYTPYLAIAFVYFSQTVQANFFPGRVDHHGLQLICLFLAIYGATDNSKKGGIISAIGIAAGLTIGFEAIVFEIIICAFFAIIWAFEGEKRKDQLTGFSIGLGISIIIGLLINVAPSKIMDGANDRLSIAQVAPILMGCFGLWLCATFQSSKSFIFKSAALAIVGVLVVLVALQFPILFKKLYWQIDEKYYRLWMLDCPDTNPLLTFPLYIQILYGMFCLTGSIAAIIKTITLAKSKNENFINWLLLTILIVVATLMTFLFQARLMGQASALVILAIAPIIVGVFEGFGMVPALLTLLCLTPFTSNNISDFAKKFYHPKNAKISYDADFNCHSISDFAHLAKKPKGLVAGNLNLGPETLINTPHNVLSTGFHRDLGRNLAYPIFLSDAKNAEAKIRTLGVNYVAYCQKSPEIGRIIDDAPSGLMADIIKGQTPSYLRKIMPVNKTDVIAFEVLPN